MSALANLWWRLVERLGFRPGFATETVGDMPKTLSHARLYLIGDQPRPWSAAMLCPCGCAATIQLSLIANDTPSWRARRHFYGSVTLQPSVWRTRGCRSHFHLRHGRIVWSGPVPGGSRTFQTTSQGPLPMQNVKYPDRIDLLAQGALSQMGDYFDIETPGAVAQLEDRALDTAAKLVYFNTIRNELKTVGSGERKPADALRHLDDVAHAWISKRCELPDHATKGASMALALSDRWRNWVVCDPLAEDRHGFMDHFGLRD